MSNDQFQNKYKEVFQSLKEEKMDWDFEDFLEKAEKTESESSDETPVIPISKNKPSFPKWFWMAASIVVIMGFIFVFTVNQNKISEKQNLVENEILKQKNDFISENHNHESQVAVHTADSVSGAKKDSIFNEKSFTENDVLDEILSKRSRIKKERKPKYVYNNPQKNLADSLGYQDSFVIVNGKRITSEKEAIDVATYSLMKIGREFKKTVASSQEKESFTNEY